MCDRCVRSTVPCSVVPPVRLRAKKWLSLVVVLLGPGTAGVEAHYDVCCEVAAILIVVGPAVVEDRDAVIGSSLVE